MPNWCNNTVTLSHDDPAMIDRAVQAINRGKLLQEFFPTPADLLAGDGWYDWRIENWGCKWDIGDSWVQRHGPTTIEFQFDSAWSPPTNAYHALLSHGFRIEAWFHEPGCQFFGSFIDGQEESFGYGDLSLAEIELNYPEHAERWAIADYFELDES